MILSSYPYRRLLSDTRPTEMASATLPQRFVLVVGDVDDVAENAEITIVERLNTVVLGEATYEAVAGLRGAPAVFIRIFHYEEDARRAFDLFAG
jgi:hypothetical protein